MMQNHSEVKVFSECTTGKLQNSASVLKYSKTQFIQVIYVYISTVFTVIAAQARNCSRENRKDQYSPQPMNDDDITLKKNHKSSR